MEAIKKKMQALKIEKDNAMDRAEAAENQLRDSNIRVEKVAFCQQGSFHEQSVTIDWTSILIIVLFLSIRQVKRRSARISQKTRADRKRA